MTNITFFDDPGEAPRPRDQIRVESVDLEPYPDGRRVKVTLRITPFGPTDRPTVNITVRDEDQLELASASVIETMDNNLSLTLHLRGEDPPVGTHSIEVGLFYDSEDAHDSKITSLTLPSQPS
jgi:hypothetical protein